MRDKKKVLAICCYCKYFEPHKTTSHFAGGWWIGDGRCTKKGSPRKYTVIGDSCQYWEPKSPNLEGI